MNKQEFRSYFAKQFTDAAPGTKLFYGITDAKQHVLLDITEDNLDMLYLKLVDEGYSLAYPAGTDFRLPWFELKE